MRAMVDFTLTDENKLVQGAARAFAEAEILPHIREWDEKGEVHREVFERMGEQGFLGAPIPEAYGGAGMDYISFAILCEELERADTAFRVVQSVHVALNSLALLQWGTEDQRRRWLVPQAKGEKLATFGLTEPGVGTDAGNLATTARKDGSAYRLNGQKIWISLAGIADHFLVFASVDRARKHKGVTAFLLERGMGGLSTGTLHGKLGIRAGNTGLINLDDVVVPEEHRIGQEGEGFLVAMSAIDQGRYTVAAGAVGLAQACVDASVKYAHERKTFGQEIGEHQLVKQLIAKMVAGTAAGVARRLAQEPGPAQHPRDVARQVARDRAFGPERAGRDPGPRRQRLLERVPGRALSAQLESSRDLRGDEPAAHAHPGRLRARLPRGPAVALRALARPGVGASVVR
jgi:glutaryl-CoA dehydrogenase (non-decarboxylating)